MAVIRCPQWSVFVLAGCWLMLIAPLPGPGSPREPTGRVSGEVSLADGTSPARGAKVMGLDHTSARSDGSFGGDPISTVNAKGRFTLPEVPLEGRGATEVRFWVVHPDYAPLQVSARLSLKAPRASVRV